MFIEQTVPSVDESLKKISMESTMLSNMTSTIVNFFPGLFEKLSSSFAMAEQIEVVEIKYTTEQKFVINNIQDKLYLDFSELKVSIPEGFKGQYVDYSEVLLESTKGMHTVIENILRPYITYLSQFLSNKDAKLGTKDMTPVYAGMARHRDAAMLAMDKFRSNSTISSAKIGDVISRKADIARVYDTTYQLTKLLKNIDLRSVKDCVKQCVDLLNIVVEQAQTGDIKNVTPEVTRNLAFGAAEVAREVEYLAVLHYRAMGLVIGVDDMTEKLSNYIKG